MMQAGYSRVAVVRGGFQGLVEAGVAVAPKDITPTSAPDSEARSVQRPA